MPAVAARTLVFTPEEYFAWEETQEERHEYHHGEVFAKSGGTSTHARLIAQLTIELGVALRGTECTLRSEAMRVRVSNDDYVYPDLTVTCEPAAFRTNTETTLLNPTLVVEVLAAPACRLSPSTRAYDVGEKFELYRTLASVQEVLFVDAARRRAEVARRTDAGWTLSGPVEGGTLRLASVDTDLDLDEVYRGIL